MRLKHTFGILITLFCAVLSFASMGQNYIEGQHYSVVAINADKPAGKSEHPSVVEYFSFSCPGCYAMESSVVNLEKVFNGLQLHRVHMPFGGQNAKYSQKVFVLMELLGAEQHKDAIFRRIHVSRNPFNSNDEIVSFFSELGYPEDKASSLLSSFSADSMIRKMNKDAVKYKIKSVPTIIVNDKYEVNIRALPQTNSLLGIVQYLHTLP